MNELSLNSSDQAFEVSLIGAICIDPGPVMAAVSGVVDAEDFTLPLCKCVYEAARQAQDGGKPFDAVIALGTIPGDQKAAEGFIRECMDVCPTAANAVVHAKEIHKAAQRRQLREALQDTLTKCVFERPDPADLAADLGTIAQNFLTTERGDGYSTMTQAVTKVYERVLNSAGEDFIKTGFPCLDHLMKGMPGGNLILLGARPAVGKTAFALAIAEHVAKTYGEVAMYSLEMGDEELAERPIARAAGVAMDDIIDNAIKPEQLTAFTVACSSISELPIKIFDRANITPAEIRRDARMFKDLKLIIIDFITLMKSDNTTENRNLEVGSISRALKNLAKEINVPILCLSQLNRGIDETDEPKLKDLRDSGELEQNANKVVFLWLEEEDENGIKTVGASVAKNRRGRKGAVQFRFNGRYMDFTELGYMEREARVKKRRYGSGALD